MIDQSSRNTLRNLRVDFGGLMDLPVAERRVELLKRCQDIYNLALEKSVMTKTGDEYANPDCHSATKIVEVVAKLAGVTEADPKAGELPEEQTKPSVAAISGAAERLERSRKSKTAA